jgi:hypothetical protein
MYVDDGGDEQIKILDHASEKVLSSFGRPGHQIGAFTLGHMFMWPRPIGAAESKNLSHRNDAMNMNTGTGTSIWRIFHTGSVVD